MTQILPVSPNYFNAKMYGAKGDGSTDDTTAIAAAITAATASGGTVFFPAGTYITTTQTLASLVNLKGSGRDCTTIKLKNGTNADLFSADTASINLSSAFNAGNTGGVYGFAITDLTLDGNKANQTSGTSYCLHFYGYGFLLENLEIKNGYSGCVLCDWNGGTNAPTYTSINLNCRIEDCEIHDCSGIGLEMGGPHDSIISNTNIYDTASHNVHFAPNAAAMVVDNSHAYSSTHGNHALAWFVESGTCSFTNCEGEGSDTVQAAFLADSNTWIGGRIFAGGSTGTGIQIGQQAGVTPYPSAILQSAGLTTSAQAHYTNINTIIANCEGSNGSVWFANDGGTRLIANIFNATGVCFTGSPNGQTNIWIQQQGTTADGTIGKGGQMLVNINSFNAFEVSNRTHDIFNIDTWDGVVALPNAAILRTYSDNYTTRAVEISNGTISVLQSTTAAAIASSGTITTNGVGIARVAPTANVTGIILQAGTNAGQRVIVRNESAFTVTFAASGSNVADGATSAIPAHCSRDFEWNSVGLVWSRMA